jgi:LEA14-like dessication related protein
MKKALGIFLAVLIVALVVYFFIENRSQEKDSADTFIKPEIELASFQINSIDDGTIKIELEVLVENKMPLSFGVDTLQYNVFMEEVLVSQSTYPEKISIAASDSSKVSLPITLYQDKINQVLQRVEQNPSNDSLNLLMEADLITDIPFTDNPIELTFTKRLYFVRQPQITVSDISIEKFGLDQSEVEMTIQVNNPNQFTFSFRKTDYEFSVNNESIAYGAVDKVTNIAAGDTTTFVVPFNVNLDEVGENVFNLLFKPKETGYEFSLSTQIDSQKDFINNSTLSVTRSGKLKELIN